MRLSIPGMPIRMKPDPPSIEQVAQPFQRCRGQPLGFHAVTAYGILRTQGIELGKADCAAHMLAHLRPPRA